MVEVFKTNIDKAGQAIRMQQLLSRSFPLLRINFDLEDCDNILRIEGGRIEKEQVIDMLVRNGFECSVLN